MELLVYIAQAFISHVRIDLSGRNIFMSKQFLNASQIRPARKEVGSIGVTERVRRGISDNSSLQCVFLHDTPDADAREAEFLTRRQSL